MALPLVREVHQVLTPEGEVVGPVPGLSDDELVRLYRWMVYGRLFSDRMVALQRQGRMGTFGPLNGQEGASVGLAAPLHAGDWLAGSYREILCYLMRGVPPLTMMAYMRGLPRPFPAEARCLPVQIVLGAQIPHAVGLAMAARYEGRDEVAVGVCGDGATSEGDFNESLNFAAVFGAPVVFVVQNNGWAISVPRERQTRAEYIAHRGPGFGVPGYVVDGNDVLAMYNVLAAAAARARAGEGPSLIEALTYRLGAHTTADDPTKYRPDAHLTEWAPRDPLLRYRTFLGARGLMDDAADAALREAIAAEIQRDVEALDALSAPDPEAFFDFVYAEAPPQLAAQRAAFRRDLGRGVPAGRA